MNRLSVGIVYRNVMMIDVMDVYGCDSFLCVFFVVFLNLLLVVIVWVLVEVLVLMVLVIGFFVVF